MAKITRHYASSDPASGLHAAWRAAALSRVHGGHPHGRESGGLAHQRGARGPPAPGQPSARLRGGWGSLRGLRGASGGGASGEPPGASGASGRRRIPRAWAMSTPEHRHPIDPVSEKLGALQAGMASLEQRLGKIEVRLKQLRSKWEIRILLALTLIQVVAVLAALRALP